MCSIIWWDKNGKAFKDLEYGRLTWDTFSLDPFLTANGVGEKDNVSGFEKTLFDMSSEDSDSTRSFANQKWYRGGENSTGSWVEININFFFALSC